MTYWINTAQTLAALIIMTIALAQGVRDIEKELENRCSDFPTPEGR